MAVSAAVFLPAILHPGAFADETPPDDKPAVYRLEVVPALTYPFHRMPVSLSGPALALDAADMNLWDSSRSGAALSHFHYVQPGGNDADGVPSRHSVSFLGMPAWHTASSIEGVRFFSDRDALGTNLNLVPFPLLDGIEMYVGAASDIIGSGPMGGVANLLLPGRRNVLDEGFHGTVSGIAGSDGRVGNMFRVTGVTSQRDITAAGARLYAQGPGVDYVSQQDALFLRGIWHPEDFGSLDALVLGGQNSYDDTDEDYHLWKVGFQSPETAFYPVSALVGSYEYKRNIRGHDEGINYGGTDLNAAIDELPVGNSTLMLKAAYRSEDVTLINARVYDRSFTGVFLRDEVPAGQDVTLDFGLSLERSSIEGESEMGGHVGAVWKTDDVTVRANLARSYRFPSLISMYESMFDMGTYYRDGDPGLDRERSVSFLLQTEKSFGDSLRIGLTLTRTVIDDFNCLAPTGEVGPDLDPVYRWYDGPDAYVQAVAFYIEGGSKLTWSFSYVNLESQEDTWEMPASYLPRNTYRLGLGTTFGNASLKVFANLVTERISPDLTRTFVYHMEDYSSVDAACSFRLQDGLSLSLSVTNLFDEDIPIYENGITTRLPGRSFAVSLEYAF